MARLYTNENFPQQAVNRLREFGHDVETSHEAGASGVGTPDIEVLQYAIRERRVLVTLNRRHFVALHERVEGHGGIVVCSFDPDFRSLAGRIHDAISNQPDITNRLIRVNRPAMT
jgi:hypothetical protein